MLRDALLEKPFWLTIVPAYPNSAAPVQETLALLKPTPEDERQWQDRFGDFDVAVPTGLKRGISVLQVNVSHAETLNLSNLILPPDITLLAATAENNNIKELYFVAPPSDQPNFQLRKDDGTLLVRYFNGDTVTFETSPSWSWPQHNVLTSLPQNILGLFQAGLLNENVPLQAETTEPKTPTTDKARQIQCRLFVSELIPSFIRGERTLFEVLEIFRNAYPNEILQECGFLYDTVLDRLERHHKRLALNWDEGLTPEYIQKYQIPFTQDHRTWSYDELQSYFRTQISGNLGDTRKMTEAVRQCLGHMAAADIDNVQQPLLLRYLAQQSGLNLSVTALRRQLLDLKQACELQTHSDIAFDFLKTLNQVTEYRYFQSHFWRWEGTHWKKTSDVILRSHISVEYGQLQSARRSSDHMGILRVLAGIIDNPLNLSTKKGVNLLNGFLDANLDLHDHHPDFGQTHVLPCEYHPENTQKPLFDKFLFETWGGDTDYPAKLKALQEIMAVTLFGMAKDYQRAFLLYGVPKSGKTQLLNIMSYLVPLEGRCNVNPADWSDRFRPAQMSNKILNVCGELSERKSIEGQNFKDIIDGTEQMSEFKGRDAFVFTPTCAHWFASNHLPKTRDTSDGFYRRWLVLTFNQPVPQGEKLIRDLGLHIVEREREAIVAWAVQGITRMLENADFTFPDSHDLAITQMASQNNSLSFFIHGSGLLKLKDPSLKSKRLTPDEKRELSKSKDFILGDTLYNTYSLWCSEVAGVRAVSSAKFHSMMREMAATHGFIQNRIRFTSGLMGYAYVNLTCNSQPALAMDDLDPTLITNASTLS